MQEKKKEQMEPLVGKNEDEKRQLIQEQTAEQDQNIEQKPEEENVFLGMKLKKATTRWNVCAIFYALFLMTCIGGYVNVQIIYLLRDPNMFGMSVEYQGRVTSSILLVAMICGLCWTFAAGFIYDLCLRKIPIFLAVVFGCLFLMLCPFTAPSEWLLTLDRALIQMCLIQLSAHPLILDYIKQESRGKGAALQNLGHLVGEAFAMSVLFGISKREDVDQIEAFAYAAAIVACLGLPILCLVTNVKVKDKKKAGDSLDQETSQQEILNEQDYERTVEVNSINAPYERSQL